MGELSRARQIWVEFEFDIQNAETYMTLGTLILDETKVRDAQKNKDNTQKEQMEGTREAMSWIIIQQEDN